jgi:hypothetical protein
MRILLFFACLLHAGLMFAQFNDDGDMQVPNFNIGPNMHRQGATGIGFANGTDFFDSRGGATLRAQFLVKGLPLGHIEGINSVFGQLDNGSTWSGLGTGNPNGSPSPYGLSMTRRNSLGFLNLIPGTIAGGSNSSKEDLILGFGASDLSPTTNRFILRSYSKGTSQQFLDFKNLLIANPAGATGINAEPLSTFWVDARQDQTAGPKNIAIVDEQPFGFVGQQSPVNASSGMGAQANGSLQANGIVAEGFRAQHTAFGVTPLPGPAPFNTAGVATNLQIVKSPFGGPNVNILIDALNANNVNGTREYAEITWQDFDISDAVSVDDCATFTIPEAESADKFFISFRNNQNVNPFGVGNKLPVMTFQANGRVGIGRLQPSSGTCTGGTYGRNAILLDVNGLITSFGTVLTSDKRFKQNIQPVTNAMDKVRQLQGTTYQFRKDEFPEQYFPTGNQYGFIAQDLEKVIPEAAFENSDGYYVANYTMLIPVLTEAIKEQDKTITTQAETIEALSAEVAELRSQFNDFKAGQEGSNNQGYRLEQNTPNPFSQSTAIAYAVPAGTTGARINVYDLTGRTIKSFPLSDVSGTVTMEGGSLTDGLYIYDLQVGGRQILERKMSVSKM